MVDTGAETATIEAGAEGEATGAGAIETEV